MDKRVLLIVVLLAVIGVGAAWFSFRTTPRSPVAEPTPSLAASVTSDVQSSPAGSATPTPTPPSPSLSSDSSPLVVAPPADQPQGSAQPKAEVDAVSSQKPQPQPVPTAPPVPDREVVGTSPYPAGGKPTGPFDITWSFSVGATRAQGTITVTHLSPTAHVTIEVVPRAGATLAQPFLEQVDLGKGESRTFPVAVGLGEGSNSLVVTVTAHGADRRARVVTIDLVPVPAAEPAIPSAVPPAGGPTASPTQSGQPAPLSGSQTIRDASGTVLELNPSAPEKK